MRSFLRCFAIKANPIVFFSTLVLHWVTHVGNSPQKSTSSHACRCGRTSSLDPREPTTDRTPRSKSHFDDLALEAIALDDSKPEDVENDSGMPAVVKVEENEIVMEGSSLDATLLRVGHDRIVDCSNAEDKIFVEVHHERSDSVRSSVQSSRESRLQRVELREVDIMA